MSYVCDWSLELPVIVNNEIVAYCPDVECVLSLDERGALFKVGFKVCDRLTWVLGGSVYEVAAEAVHSDRSHIMELCGVPSDVRYPPIERPDYTGPEYRPVNI